MTDSAQNTHRTKPAHIGFFTIPAHGHINPTLALVAELVNRGHHVSYAVTDPLADLVAEAGATPVRYTSTLPGSPTATRQEWPEEEVEARLMFLEETKTVVPQLEQAYAADRPDLVVYDLPDFLALAEKWGVPELQLCPTHVYTPGLESVLDMTPTPEKIAVQEAYDEYFAEQGLTLREKDFMHPRRCIVTLPRSFQYFGDQAADAYTFVGPMLTERAFQGDWQAPDDRPVLVISLGSAYNDRLDFYRTCLRAFADLDWHVVLSVGKSVDPAELGEIPANFEVHQWIPQVRMLSQASAFITHAGMGGTMEGLHHGVPLIAVPQAADQFMNAARIEELGLGVQLDGATATPEQLRAALEKVTSDEEIRNRLADVRREIKEAGGLARAVEIVEALL
ncbi:glycosyltransferase, MGT family [Saccharopolyspora antimicrobica]|uniref:Glycosyltransferase, MGT family n=1 Tax=Saccharopolyspora antimicrobica TaxID=455193 RepID=A0A1I5HC13_9PSEU|nr:macrolide family glycosyltransferase [Saccharopolyspora antimicrobica]RKT85376.1 MGT family glycosyltransferase [Saccharopolyspora antimicrobica]SFO45868.1 glycosyltransferase, MGT family [Saccharopolyspora antimicrobica]